MMNLDISSASITDCSIIHKLIRSDINSTLKSQLYHWLFSLYLSITIKENILNTYTVKVNNDIIGAISYSIYNKNNIIISNLIIDKAYRNKGIGTILLNKIKYKLWYKYKPENIYLYDRVYLTDNDNKDRRTLFFNKNEFYECRRDENIIETILRNLNILTLYKYEEDSDYLKY